MPSSGASRTPPGQPVIGTGVICADLGRVVFPAAGGYRLVVTNSGTTAESFKVTWEASRPDIVKPLQAGQTASGNIDKPGAQDVWTMTATAGEVAYLAADPSCATANEYAILWNLSDATGAAVIGSSYICSNLGRIVFPKTGTYRLVIASADGKTAPYSVSLGGVPARSVQAIAGRADGLGDHRQAGRPRHLDDDRVGRNRRVLRRGPVVRPLHEFALTWNINNADGSALIGSSYICSDLGRVVFAQAGTYQLVVSSVGRQDQAVLGDLGSVAARSVQAVAGGADRLGDDRQAGRARPVDHHGGGRRRRCISAPHRHATPRTTRT